MVALNQARRIVHSNRRSIASAEMIRWSIANGVGNCTDFEVLDEVGHVVRVTFPIDRHRLGMAVLDANDGRPVRVTAIVHLDEPMPPCVLARGRLT